MEIFVFLIFHQFFVVKFGRFEECLLIPKLKLSSEKLINEGFRFEYGINEMYDQMIEYFESKGLIKAKESWFWYNVTMKFMSVWVFDLILIL